MWGEKKLCLCSYMQKKTKLCKLIVIFTLIVQSNIKVKIKAASMQMTVNTKPVTPTAPAFQYCDKAIDQNKSTCCLLLLCRSSEASVYTIFTRVGVNNSHLSKGVNLTPKQRTPEVPEEYLEHCSYSLSPPPPPQSPLALSHELQHMLRPARSPRCAAAQ